MCLCLSLLPTTLIAQPIPDYAKNVTRHVLAHELAHALIKEFDLPVSANEEAMADSFATIWFIQNDREAAPDIIMDTVQSWLLDAEAYDVSEDDYKAEHPLDTRRAYQAACLFYGSDPIEWEEHVDWLDFPQEDLDNCSDTAPDQVRGWTTLLEPHMLQSGKTLSNKVKVKYAEGPMKAAMKTSAVIEDFAQDARQFNWPNTITIHFDRCDKGAYWDSEERLIMLCDDYVTEFIEQDEIIKETID